MAETCGDTGVYLARDLLGLEFKMGSEIRTVVVREWKEIGIVARCSSGSPYILLHWEIKEEEKKAADIRNKGSLFIDHICGFRKSTYKD